MEDISRKRIVTIYTDGACSGNPGPGGWGAILEYQGQEKELSGGETETTNNRMELMGVISALEALKRPCQVELYSDSQYVINAVEKGWAIRWRQNGWMRNKREPALNPDLWERLLKLLEVHQVTFHWVKGHAENPKNNRCDALAVAESKKYAQTGNAEA
ncbi:MAG: ribonuclease HI [Oscillospiraceae bacterium]|nr:ribonuclease HI [Oscillospiraceae bacterium]